MTDNRVPLVGDAFRCPYCGNVVRSFVDRFSNLTFLRANDGALCVAVTKGIHVACGFRRHRGTPRASECERVYLHRWESHPNLESMGRYG
jgi:hypothetical protein